MAEMTWYIDREKEKIVGVCSELDALKQSIFDMLSTQRFAHLIYTEDYGSNLDWYIGKDYELVVADIGREIEESLMIDDRITGVDGFSFGDRVQDKLEISFNVSSVFGDFEMRVAI